MKNMFIEFDRLRDFFMLIKIYFSLFRTRILIILKTILNCTIFELFNLIIISIYNEFNLKHIKLKIVLMSLFFFGYENS